MEGAWAFNWVQILRHQSRLVWLFGLTLTGFALWGWTDFTAALWQPVVLALMALVVMSLLCIYLLDSFKSAVFIFGASSLLFLLLIGLGQLFNDNYQESTVFGWVIILIMMMSNLTHIITTLHREMARGAHQFDGIAEAIRINSGPIFLSNTTTLAGFLMVGWFDSAFQEMALTVLLGWALITILLLIFLPWIMMNWLLEFRVGHYQDRHGFLFIADYLQKSPMIAKALSALLIAMAAVALGLLIWAFSDYQVLLMMLLSSGILLGIFWQNLKLTFAVLAVSALAVLLAFAMMKLSIAFDEQALLITLVIPLGIVLDDAIHFFSRIRRAKQGFYRDDLSAIRFTLSSIGRPIWNTSLLLFVGLMVLLIFGNSMIYQLSILTLLSIALATFMVLVLLPAIYISKSL